MEENNLITILLRDWLNMTAARLKLKIILSIILTSLQLMKVLDYTFQVLNTQVLNTCLHLM